MSDVEHFLYAVRGDSQPTRLVGVACEQETGKEDHASGVVRCALVRWAACGYETQSGRQAARWEAQGSDGKSFWSCARWALKRGGKTWVVAGNAVRVLGLLGTWEMIENGQICLSTASVPSGTDCAGSSPVPCVQDDCTGAADDAGRGIVDSLPQLSRRNRDRHSAPPIQTGAGKKQGAATVIEDPPTIVGLRMPGLPGTLHVVDLRNYGIRDYPRELPVERQASWVAFCMEEMCKILRVYGLGSLQSTAGAQALHTFRRRFMTHSIWCHRNPAALELERAALVGGRCECFRLGKIEGPVYHVDFRSLYPSICATADLPARQVEGNGLNVVRRDSLGQRDYLALADVTLSTDEPAYPYRRGSHIIYPVGRFRTVLAGPELTDACELDRVVRVHSALMYEGRPALQAYATELYAILEEYRHMGHPPTVQWLKALLVCLPGKFAQRDSRWVPAHGVSPPAYWSDWFRRGKGGDLVRHRSLGGNVEMEEGCGFAFNACPAITAWVNSAGRIALLNAIRAAGRDNVSYMDTDSLFLSDTGFRRLESAGMVGAGQLGRLRLVNRYSTAMIHGIKHYEVDGRRVCAGVPLDPRDKAQKGDAYWYNNWIKRQIAGNHRPEVERILRQYARGAAYAHGNVGDNGEVWPFRIEE